MAGRARLLFGLVFILSACNRDGTGGSQADAGIEGTWDLASRDAGKGPEEAPGIQLVISKERILFRASSGATKTMGDIARLDPFKTPKEIDLRNGADVGFGVYELDGDSLSLIVCDPGQPRPKALRGTPKGMLFKLRRAK